jgi:hypothetical protein
LLARRLLARLMVFMVTFAVLYTLAAVTGLLSD